MNIFRINNIKHAAVLAGIVFAQAAVADNYGNRHSRHRGESVEISNHHEFVSGDLADGATVLIRDGRDREISASISSRALEPDSAYSIWWAVFNYPRYCIEPYACALADLGDQGDPRVRPSVFWGGGFISDGSGITNSSIKLRPGRTSRELFANTKPYGLRNFWGAELHVVLRWHGATGLAGTVAEQVGTANMACPDGGCKNVFASIHKRSRR